MENLVMATSRKLANVKMENLSAEEMLKMMEDELEEEMQCQNRIHLALAKLKTLRFSASEVCLHSDFILLKSESTHDG